MEENGAIYAALGDVMGKLHSTTFDRFGDVGPGDEGLWVGPMIEAGIDDLAGPFETWQEFHSRIVGTRLQLMRGTGFEDLIDPIEAWFEEHQRDIDYPIVPRLLHMDVHRGNVLIANGEVSGILDVEESIAGHNEYDLMRTELANFRGQSPAFEASFTQAYRQHVRLDEGYESRRTFYDVSRTLAWFQSLILHGEKYVRGQSGQAHEAARAHLLSLID